MKNLSILVANFNTNQETPNMLKSLVKVSESVPKVVVMNTSTIDECELPLQIDAIPYFNYRGGIHGEAINLGLRKVNTRYVLLVDSDIIFLKNPTPAFEKFKESGCALMGKVVGDCAGKNLYPRVEPWCCFIDTHQLKQHKIEFFDRDRHMKRHTEEVDRIYDVGSTMFEDCQKAGLSIADASMEGKYFKHYGGMSWHVNKYNKNEKDTDVDFGGTHPNMMLYTHGCKVKHRYDEDTKDLKSVNITGVFSHD